MHLIDHLRSKLLFWRHKNINKVFKKYVLPLAIITIVWEIIEDVVFPLIFYFLGKHVHPSFYAGMPVAWLLCIHPIAIPIIFAIYCHVNNKVNYPGP
jgi:hypothetical protein